MVSRAAATCNGIYGFINIYKFTELLCIVIVLPQICRELALGYKGLNSPVIISLQCHFVALWQSLGHGLLTITKSMQLFCLDIIYCSLLGPRQYYTGLQCIQVYVARGSVRHCGQRSSDPDPHASGPTRPAVNLSITQSHPTPALDPFSCPTPSSSLPNARQRLPLPLALSLPSSHWHQPRQAQTPPLTLHAHAHACLGSLQSHTSLSPPPSPCPAALSPSQQRRRRRRLAVVHDEALALVLVRDRRRRGVRGGASAVAGVSMSVIIYVGEARRWWF